MNMRTTSASTRASGGSGGGMTSRRYRRIAHSPQIDDTLFGSKPGKKNDRTRQAGREIVGSTNQQEDRPVGRGAPPRSNHPIVIVDDLDVNRIKQDTKIYTAAELEAKEAGRDAEQEQLRLSAKARKEHMRQLSTEAALRAPKTQIEQVLEEEKQEVLRKAKILKDSDHDSVKLIRTLGARAQAFTIRDQQKQIKEKLQEEHVVYDEKMNLLMEVERLEGLKKQEEIEEIKRQKRYADRRVLEEQIEERRRQRQIEQQQVQKEAEHVLAQIKQQQEEEVDRERRKVERARHSMEEIQGFNALAHARKAQEKQKIREAEEKVLAYQMKKAEEQRLWEEEEARKRHEAELRCAKLRSTQEKMANEKAELDELRAKRAADARERQAREAELALYQKQRQEMEELQKEREAQALYRQRARVKEATMQQMEYESIMSQVQMDKERVKEEEEKMKRDSLQHRKVLQHQIEERQNGRKGSFEKKQAEGQALKEEYAKELEKLERIRLEEVEELVKAGVNPLYLTEMKALDIERIRNR